MTAEIYMTIITGLLGVVGFFLTRAFTSLDKKADKSELETLKNEVGALREIIADVKDNYLTKGDFIREFSRLEGKIDKLTDYNTEKIGYILEKLGGSRHE